MTARRSRLLAPPAALAICVALAPATGAQGTEADPGGGTAVSGQVASVLELSVQRGGPDVVTAQVTTSIPRTQLLVGYLGAAPGSALRIGAGATPIRPGAPRALAAWSTAVTRSRVVLRARLTPARARASAVLEITAAPQTP